jgi:hypothetical protein
MYVATADWIALNRAIGIFRENDRRAGILHGVFQCRSVDRD